MAVIRGALEYLERSRLHCRRTSFVTFYFTMMNIKKGMIAAAAIAALGTGSLSVMSAFAAENTSPRMMGMENLVQALADKFGVSTDEVQAVFDEQRAEMKTNREEHEAERLAQAVTDGILTQEQADAISEHRDEMQTFMESLKDATPKERKEALDAQREENKAWAEENDIPEQFLRHEGPRNGHGHRPFNENAE